MEMNFQHLDKKTPDRYLNEMLSSNGPITQKNSHIQTALGYMHQRSQQDEEIKENAAKRAAKQGAAQLDKRRAAKAPAPQPVVIKPAVQ